MCIVMRVYLSDIPKSIKLLYPSISFTVAVVVVSGAAYAYAAAATAAVVVTHTHHTLNI